MIVPGILPAVTPGIHPVITNTHKRNVRTMPTNTNENTHREIRLRPFGDGYQVIVNDRLAAEITFRVHVGWHNGEPTYVETMPANLAADIAAQVARTLNHEFNS